MTTAPTPSAARERSGRGVGVLRQQDDGVGLAGVGLVDARVRAHEAVAGAADQAAVVGAQRARSVSSRIGLDVARVLVVLGGELAGAPPRLDVGQPRARGPRPSRRPCARSTRTSSGPSSDAVAQQRGQVVPGRTSGHARERRSSLTRRATSRSSSARVRGAAPGRARERGAQRGEVARGVDVELERRQPRRPDGRARRVGERRRGARRSRGRRRASSTVGGSSRSALVPEPWRSGTMTTPGAALGRAARRPRPDPAPGSRRARAGRAAPRVPPPSARRAAPPRTGPPRRDRAHQSTPRPLRRARPTRPRAASSPRTAPSASSTSPTIAAASSARSTPSGPQALLRAPERLDGEDGDRTHGARHYPRSAAANTSVSSATRRRASASPISTSVSSVGTPLARSSLTSPSIRPVVVGDDPVRVQRMPGPLHEQVGRALRAPRRAPAARPPRPAPPWLAARRRSRPPRGSARSR